LLPAAALAGCCLCQAPESRRGETLVVVVPTASGHVGAVMVNPGPQQVLLDRAYAGAHVQAGSAPARETLSAGDVEARFADARRAMPEPPVTYVMHFVLGTSELTEDSRQTMETVVAEVARRPGADVSVVGYTDALGSTEHNDTLSLRRAQSVRDYMIAHGLRGDLIRAMGRGERDSSGSDVDDATNPGDRRVDVIVR
jgi:outer membrane protein OmpA-like peptidoglycan-associated protein